MKGYTTRGGRACNTLIGKSYEGTVMLDFRASLRR